MKRLAILTSTALALVAGKGFAQESRFPDSRRAGERHPRGREGRPRSHPRVAGRESEGTTEVGASGAIEGVLDVGYAVSSFYDWQLAAIAIANLALLDAPPTPERELALQKGMAWFTAARLPKRGSDWDNDAVWALLYGTVLCSEAADDPRFGGEDWQARLQELGRTYVAGLVRNQVPTGGWGYYDDPTYTRRPKWATSFSTALVLPALQRALERGWCEDGAVLRRAPRLRASLPPAEWRLRVRPAPDPAGSPWGSTSTT